MQAEVFLDASYAIALSSSDDELHEESLILADELAACKKRLVTTWAVVLEIGNALSKQRYRESAVRLLASLFADANVEVVSFSTELFHQSFQLYAERIDKEWGLTDCISFVVMSDRGITEALTADEHFRQAGFQMLMR